MMEFLRLSLESIDLGGIALIISVCSNFLMVYYTSKFKIREIKIASFYEKKMQAYLDFCDQAESAHIELYDFGNDVSQDTAVGIQNTVYRLLHSAAKLKALATDEERKYIEGSLSNLRQFTLVEKILETQGPEMLADVKEYRIKFDELQSEFIKSLSR